MPKEITMQNIPGIALDTSSDERKPLKFSGFAKTDSQTMFADVFEQHSTLVENELAMAPISTNEKILDATPKVKEEPKTTHAPADTKLRAREEREARETKAREREERMTREDMDKVRDDLKEYGLSEKEIAEIEEKVNSEEGMTWGEFVTTLSAKMEQMRKVVLSDEQKGKLGSMFAKLGFTAEESATLISQLENGEQDKVMSAMQAKLAELPKAQQLLLTKEEVEAFSTAMSFSKEFTSKIKEMIGSNSTTRDLKEAFTLIRQEMAEMDAKDRKLVKAVGKAFVQAMGEQAKDSTAAKDIQAAVDLKPRVTDEGVKAEAKAQTREDFKEAVDTRKDTMPAETRKAVKQAVPEKAEADLPNGQESKSDSDDAWNNFFGKLRDDSAQSGEARNQTKADALASLLKTDTTDLAGKSQPKAWAKVAAPKVMHQVENAIFKNLSDGTKQLTLQLTPENLGKLSIVLQVQGKEVNAVIRADNAEAARVIHQNIDAIRSSLEDQGLKVEKLDVQAGLTGNQNGQSWSGNEQHNMARDREVMTAMRNHMRAMRGEAGGSALSMSNASNPMPRTEQGIHVIA
jgi:Flagellar hook-length control protein FliK.